MIDVALSALQHRSQQLRLALESGVASDIRVARENVRLSIVELYNLGYWRDRPQSFRSYIQLYRLCRCLDTSLSVPPSRSVPDRMARYSP